MLFISPIGYSDEGKFFISDEDLLMIVDAINDVHIDRLNGTIKSLTGHIAELISLVPEKQLPEELYQEILITLRSANREI